MKRIAGLTVLVALILAASPGVAATRGAGPVAHWKFDEGTSTTASDSSGNGNDASLFGAAWTSASAKGKFALQFDGVDDYAEVAYDPALDLGTTGWTISLWIKADPTQAGGYAGLLDKCHTCQGGWVMSIFPGGQIGMNVSGIAGTHVFTVDSVLDNVFHHVASTWDGTSLKMYLDGVLKQTVPHTDTPVAETANLLIGNHYCCYRPLNGVLDDVRIYATALTAKQVTKLAAK